MNTCPNCQSTFTCEASQTNTCWCMSIPAFLEPDPERDCFCPACLAIATAKSIEEKLLGKTKEQMLAIAQPYNNSSGFVEYIDYSIENGKYVFSKWYHLKRGSCCDSGCRNCPY